MGGCGPEGQEKCGKTAGARKNSWVLWPGEKKSRGGKKLFSALYEELIKLILNSPENRTKTKG